MTTNEAIIILEEVSLIDDSLYQYNEKYLEALKMAINALEIFKQAREAGFRGEEVEFYIGGRKFAIRELAQ